MTRDVFGYRYLLDLNMKTNNRKDPTPSLYNSSMIWPDDNAD